MINLDIVLRTCSRGVIDNMPRICGNDRRDMILRCFTSLIQTINASNNPNINYHLYILDDHSEQSFVYEISKLVSICNKKYTLISLQTSGFNSSAFEQFRYGRDICKGLVYFVEDDYLHALDAIDSMLDAYFYFRGMSDLNEVAIYPYDSTHNYDNNKLPEPTRLFYDGKRYWRSTSKSANTMLLHSNTVKTYFPLFEILATKYGTDHNINEDTTINRMYNNTVTMGGPVWLFSPIPSVAVHLAYHTMYINTTMFNWKEQYDSVDYNKILNE